LMKPTMPPNTSPFVLCAIAAEENVAPIKTNAITIVFMSSSSLIVRKGERA